MNRVEGMRLRPGLPRAVRQVPRHLGQRACGCHVAIHSVERAEVVYCETHAAAPKLLAALERLLPYAETEIQRRKYSQNTAVELARLAAVAARTVIRKARGASATG